MKNYEANFKKNIEFFKRTNPELIKTMLEKGIFHQNINITNENGDISIGFMGENIKNLKYLSDKKIKDLKKDLTYLYTPLKIVESEIFKDLDDLFEKQVEDSILNFNKVLETNSLIVLGTIPFFHLEKLIEKKIFKNLEKIYIFEPSLYIFYSSLFFIDYQSFFKESLEKGIKVKIEIVPNEYTINNLFISELTTQVILDGFIPILKSYDSPEMKQLEITMKNAFLRFLSLVPSEHYKEAIKNILKNIKGKHKVLKPNDKVDLKNVPLLIVGSGPSLDKEIENIKKFRDKCFIIALNTAGGILIKNGINPDFIINVDTITTYENSFNGVEKSELKKSILLYSINTPLEFINLFDKKYLIYLFFLRYFIKDKIFRKDESSTTVVVNAFEAAVEMGFRDIILVGVDLGSVKKTTLHSKDYPSSAMPKEIEVEKLKKSLITKGNFRNQVYTTNEFYLSKLSLENLAEEYKKIFPNLTLVNASDGVYIKGFTPLMFRNLFSLSYKEKPSISGIIKFKKFKKLEFRKDVMEETYKTISYYHHLIYSLISSIKNSNFNLFKDTIEKIIEAKKKFKIAFIFYHIDLIMLFERLYFLRLFFKDEKEYRAFFEEYSHNINPQILENLEELQKIYEKFITSLKKKVK